MNISELETETEPVVNIGTAIVLLAISFIGLFANLLVFITFLAFRYWNKGLLIVLFVNLLFCNTAQLLIISVYLVPDILCNFFTDSSENIMYSISLWFWYGTLSGYLFISTYCYFYICHSERLLSWFTKIRVSIAIVISWSASLVISLSAFVGFGCANIILMNYAEEATNECETYHGFVANPLQIFTHCINFVVVFWMTFCYFAIVKHLKKVKPDDNGTLFIRIANYTAETGYRRKRLLAFQFLSVSSCFIAFCTLCLIANLSNINDAVVVSQRILYVLHSALPPLVLIRTTKSLRRDICATVKVLTCRAAQLTPALASPQAIDLNVAQYIGTNVADSIQRPVKLERANTSSGSILSTIKL